MFSIAGCFFVAEKNSNYCFEFLPPFPKQFIVSCLDYNLFIFVFKFGFKYKQ